MPRWLRLARNRRRYEKIAGTTTGLGEPRGVVSPISKGDIMITVVTRWEGSPGAIHAVEVGSRAARSQHEAWGAQNPRLLRPAVGSGGLEVAFYTLDFSSMAAWGAFQDQMMASDWFVQLQRDVGAAHPDLRMADTTILYDAIG